MMFEDAINNCCECKDDGTAGLKQPFLYPFLDARAADTRRAMAGAVDLEVEDTDDNGIKVIQVTYPLEYEPSSPLFAYRPEPISPLRASQQAADQGK